MPECSENGRARVIMTEYGKVFGEDCGCLCSRGPERMNLKAPLLSGDEDPRKIIKEIVSHWGKGGYGRIRQVCRVESTCFPVLRTLQAQKKRLENEKHAPLIQNKGQEYRNRIPKPLFEVSTLPLTVPKPSLVVPRRRRISCVLNLIQPNAIAPANKN